MSVGTWNPAQQITELTRPVIDELLAAAVVAPEDDFGLSTAAVERLAGAAHTNRVQWGPMAQGLSTNELIGLARLFTLAEAKFPSWKADANSPVIVFAKILRERSAWPADLTEWIKQHSQNKFLPYGSLMHRL